jgi:hypothetical protein
VYEFRAPFFGFGRGMMCGPRILHLMRRAVFGSCSLPVRSGDQVPPSCVILSRLREWKDAQGGRATDKAKTSASRMGPQSLAHGYDTFSRKGVCIISNRSHRSFIDGNSGLPGFSPESGWRDRCAWYLFNASGCWDPGGSSLLARMTACVPKARGQTRTLGHVQHSPNIDTVNTRTET